MTQQDDDLQGGGPRPNADHSADHSPSPNPGPDNDIGPPGQPHDALFKAILSVPEYLIAILRWLLSAAVVREFADRPPQAVDKSFTAGLRQSHCDVVYRIALRAGRGGPLFVPFEHKSAPDAGVLLQLLGYQQAIWERYAKADGQGGLELPLVVPVVAYNGPRRWNIPKRLSRQFKGRGATAEAARERAEFSPILWDLWETPLEELTDDPELQAVAAVFRGDPKSTRRSGIGAAERRDLLVRIARDLPLLREEPLYRRVAKDALYYVYWAWGPDAWPFLNRQIPLARGEEGARTMKTYREHWLETEGQQYLARGMAQGEAKGKAETLVQILEHRFGGLSDADRARITQAPTDELEAWTLRITDVDSPESLFNGAGEARH